MSGDDKRQFQIFRGADAPSLSETGSMTMADFAPAILPTLLQVQEAGVSDGESVHVLCNLPGFSLTHVWFKKNYPLPLHSHDADCLYYVIARTGSSCWNFVTQRSLISSIMRTASRSGKRRSRP